MPFERTDNSVENAEGVQQAGRDIHGISPAEHRRIVEGLIADKQRELTAQQALLERAHAAELGAAQSQITLLTNQITELRRKLSNPDAAYAEDTARAADIAARLDREANHLGQEKIAAAKEALQRLDYSKADALFEEVKAQNQLALEQIARAEFGQGEIAEAKVDWHRAALHYGRSVELQPSLETLPKAYEFFWRSGNYSRALSICEQNLELARQEGTTRQLSSALNDLGLIMKYMGRYEESETLYRQASALDKTELGESHPEYAIDVNNLASLLESMERLDEAECLYRQAIAIGKDTIGETNAVYANRLNNLAGLLKTKGDYTEAEELLRKAIAIDKEVLEEFHPDYAIHLNNLANLLDQVERHAEAEPLYKHAIGIIKTTLGELHPDYAVQLNNLAVLYYRLGRFVDAARHSEKALAVLETVLPTTHPNVMIARNVFETIREKLN
ncbi:tetratricopeptide repeat protein [Tropicibacter alexandrii]|uniref:tetratricopeptide repeat protein n=1 Tax=Tropicibacter alexandrii TaxID=2267683 RepID=UPI000EF4D073|nr:tetratricopeptide repeat protein [Tropicibacter alexandrii]